MYRFYDEYDSEFFNTEIVGARDPALLWPEKPNK